jgi:hypothetical protein
LIGLGAGAGGAAGLGADSSSFRLFHIQDDLLLTNTKYQKDATIVLRLWIMRQRNCLGFIANEGSGIAAVGMGPEQPLLLRFAERIF